MSANAVALVVAAGSGERLGAGGPKAFAALAGRPMLEWSIDALRGVAAIEQIVVALPEGFEAPQGTVGVIGGATRSQSVLNALAAATPGAGVVVVHDAARPLVSAALIEDCITALDQDGSWDAAIAAAPVKDTIKRSSDGIGVVETPPRSELWAVQTPQVFRREALEQALASPEHELAAASDDAMLVEANGGRVRLVLCESENFKVTTQADLALAAQLLAQPAAAGGSNV
ncbi:MAG: 2-C-methyl-D-erythritol 4-phosphate cytidylyltransferase [Actinomycetes bacterium]|jgi:2-C-methyl-D-erythritol 4-phosphate cytidylyltransferase